MSSHRERVIEFVESLDRRDWAAWVALMHPDVVYEVPQTRERIRGRDAYLLFNQEYPGEWHLKVHVAVADPRNGAVWFHWMLPGEEVADAMVFFTFDEESLITSVTDFWPEPYEPPAGREHLVERW